MKVYVPFFGCADVVIGRSIGSWLFRMASITVMNSQSEDFFFENSERAETAEKAIFENLLLNCYQMKTTENINMETITEE